MSPKPEPKLPPGTASAWSGAGENFAFHSSPESFITNRILQYHKDHPSDIAKRTPVRAKILNRNVAIVSSYDQIKQVLDCREGETNDDENPPYVAAAPYNRLMEPFFPPPNLLLRDGCPHRQSKEKWKERFGPLLDQTTRDCLRDITNDFFARVPLDASLELYATLKDLAWQIFLSTFLNLTPQTPEYAELEKLQECLLRGQFSLFPVTVNTPFWQSPRKVGIDARKKLQTLIAKQLQKARPAWLDTEALSASEIEETVNHILMATSSLAVKGTASLLMAFLLNIYLSPHDIANIMSSQPPHKQTELAHSVLKESLRLSPPIVGVMRRTIQQRQLTTTSQTEPNTLIPQGWDIWSYFPGGNRDPAIFGSDADIFNPSRYIEDALPEPMSFGLGSKRCLGQSFVEVAAMAVLEALQKQRMRMEGDVGAAGVRAWLGWEVAEPGDWARDMKQLPTQRPAKAVMVRFVKDG